MKSILPLHYYLLLLLLLHLRFTITNFRTIIMLYFINKTEGASKGGMMPLPVQFKAAINTPMYSHPLLAMSTLAKRKVHGVTRLTI